MRINSFYIEGTKKVRSDLFAEIAEEIASSFVVIRNDSRGNTITNGVTKTQLRRLYNEVKRFELLLDGSIGKWEKNFPYIRMIKSKASYNITRAKTPFTSTGYENLSAFIMEGINLIKDEKDYHVFTALFEAVYGFYYVKNPKID